MLPQNFVLNFKKLLCQKIIAIYYLRQKKYIFCDNNQNKVEDIILAKNDWTLSIPWGWEMINNSPDSAFVWIGKEMPFQWMSVSWDSGSYTDNELFVGNYIWNMPERNYKNIRFNVTITSNLF